MGVGAAPSPHSPAPHPTVAAAIAAAREAGEIALRYYHGGFEVTIKPDQTPVTQADREAEQAIRRVLGRAFPTDGFLGEEFGERSSAELRISTVNQLPHPVPAPRPSRLVVPSERRDPPAVEDGPVGLDDVRPD